MRQAKALETQAEQHRVLVETLHVSAVIPLRLILCHLASCSGLLALPRAGADSHAGEPGVFRREPRNGSFCTRC